VVKKIKSKAARPIKKNGNRYYTGQKRFQVYETLKWDKIWSPCCGFRLRLLTEKKSRRVRTTTSCAARLAIVEV